MNKIIYIENKCVNNIHYYVERLLNKTLYVQRGYFNSIATIYEDFENIKPFLKTINKKIYDHRETLSDKISMNDLNNDFNNIQYLFYIIKGYLLTIARKKKLQTGSVEYNIRIKQPEFCEINALIETLIKVINMYKKNAKLKRKIVNRLYLDYYTQKKFYKNLTDYILSYM